MFFYRYNINDYDFIIVEEKGFITRISVDYEDARGIKKETNLIKKVHHELIEYFNGKIKDFTFPIKYEGTEFQNKVWNTLKNIPYGESRTYKDIALAIDNPKAARAVGNANNKNPLLIVVPCHRVIGLNGDLKGFACGVKLKKELLELEK